MKIRQPVTVWTGYPGSDRTETWESGFVTPPVYSWVEQEGQLYWQIGELPPIRYIAHDSKALDVIPDPGGAKFINPPNYQGEFQVDFDAIAGNLGSVLKVGAYLAAFLFGWELYTIFNK